jgi:hypothetical protein
MSFRSAAVSLTAAFTLLALAGPTSHAATCAAGQIPYNFSNQCGAPATPSSTPPPPD